MPGPSRAGALIYAHDLQRLSAFYQRLLGMALLIADADHHVLESPDFQLIVHAIPPHIASTFRIASPPERREDGAIKLFFSIDSLQTARATARALGGDLDEQGWQGPGFRVHNGHDPEGNILHLREWLA